MAKNSPTTTPQKRKPRLLWANPFCLLDTSSGASMTVRQMLHQLVKNGYEVQVLGCTIFDNPKGMGRLKDQYPDFKSSLHQLIEVEDDALSHQLVVTARTTRNHLTAHEEGLWYSQYLYLLDSFKPDIVWFYGGQTLDLLIPDEARARGIPSAFYLANGNYKAVRWCRDIDLILTDSQSTADMYRTSRNAGFSATPVGKFIDPANFVAETHERKRLLFVNPSWQKGASIVVQLALALEKKRPDIQLEVVEARADWSAVLRETTKKLGEERASLSNVTVTPNTNDMRGPYSRARLLLAPSLWWESSGRVLAEAMLNGIPALITNRGGMPEMIGDAGLAFDFPEECYKEPYQHLLDEEQLQPLLDAVLDFYDDTALYEKYVQRAWEVGKQRHHINQATERLVNALAPLMKLKAGNKDFTLSQQKRHRQGLASIASKPKFKVDASLLAQRKSPDSSEKSTPLPTGDFDWQLSGKLIVLDSRAKLLKMGAAKSLTDTGAFGIIAFDPASEVSNPKQYEGSETIQVFQHALLGDGNPATLHTCLDAGMSSTLEPLPQEELPEQHHQGAKVLTKLPINTVALDKIEGLPSIDWLILDELSDTATILEHGQQALKDTLIIQARVAFQPTHKHQPSLAELQHWASRNGFRFYRLNESQHASHLPQDIPEQKRQATELVSADALFLPSAKRMKTLSEGQRTRLAFLLHTVFNITDITFEILNSDNAKTSKKYLEATGLLESTTNNAQRFKNVQDIVEHLEKARLEKISSNHTLPGKLVVSLTSYKARFNNLHLTLRSLLLQETQPDFLILWIAEHEKNDIPYNVLELEKYGLNIRFCKDLRSYKKIIPTLEGYPDSFIVTADDDIYYKPDWLLKLVDSWDGNYKTVIAHRAHKIRFDNKENLAPYRSWKWQVGPEEAADGLIVPTGCGGVMYPPRVFHKDVTKSETFIELCPDADDIWLYWMFSLNGAKAKRSNYEFQLIEWPCADKNGLWQTNILQNGNDKKINKLITQYGKPWNLFFSYEKNKINNNTKIFDYDNRSCTTPPSSPSFHLEVNGKRIAYTYIRKNACSAFKELFKYYSDHSFPSDRNPIETMLKHHRIKSLEEARNTEFQVAVLRDPYERAVSLYKNKFIQRSGHEDIFKNFKKVTGVDPYLPA